MRRKINLLIALTVVILFSSIFASAQTCVVYFWPDIDGIRSIATSGSLSIDNGVDKKENQKCKSFAKFINDMMNKGWALTHSNYFADKNNESPIIFLVFQKADDTKNNDKKSDSDTQEDTNAS